MDNFTSHQDSLHTYLCSDVESGNLCNSFRNSLRNLLSISLNLQTATKYDESDCSGRRSAHRGRRHTWYGRVWQGMVGYGRLWYGRVWCSVVWCDPAYLEQPTQPPTHSPTHSPTHPLPPNRASHACTFVSIPMFSPAPRPLFRSLWHSALPYPAVSTDKHLPGRVEPSSAIQSEGPS